MCVARVWLNSGLILASDAGSTRTPNRGEREDGEQELDSKTWSRKCFRLAFGTTGKEMLVLMMMCSSPLHHWHTGRLEKPDKDARKRWRRPYLDCLLSEDSLVVNQVNKSQKQRSQRLGFSPGLLLRDVFRG